MVFLGVWALFGVGSLATGRSPLSTGLTERTGQVLARAEVSIPPSVHPDLLPEASVADSILSAQLSGEPAVFEYFQSGLDVLADHPDNGPSMEFIIGRISAWICTTLYLTSRLPQIGAAVEVSHYAEGDLYTSAYDLGGSVTGAVPGADKPLPAVWTALSAFG